MFKDRKDAGKRLARRLKAYSGGNALVLALPRGGVVVGHQVAEMLNLPLDILAVRKIGHPSESEYAIGAVDENGVSLLNEEETGLLDKTVLQKEVAKERKEAKRRAIVYRPKGASLAIAGKIIIIADDGIATALTMQLAVRVVKAQKPEKIIIAVTVASFEAIRNLEAEGIDEIITLEPPESFDGAVSAYYENFDQVDDAEIVKLLQLSPRAFPA